MSVRDYLKSCLDKNRRTAILGVGSVLRSDDAAGMYMIELLEKSLGSNENVLLAAGSTAPENFTGVIKDFKPDTLIVVDASQMGEQPGATMAVPEDKISGATFSTHMLPMSVMLGYLSQECGCEVHVIGIQPKDIGMGTEMCPEVMAAVEAVAKDITDCLLP